MLVKYPRTHLEGSRQQPGGFDLAAVSFARVAGRHPVVEEKLDGLATIAGAALVGLLVPAFVRYRARTDTEPSVA